MRKQLRADLMLLMVALFWGGSYLMIKIALKEMGTFNLIALRFIMAFVIAYFAFFKKTRKVDKETLKYALILGSCLFSVYVTITYGVQYTTVSNAGFLAALAVVMIPIISVIFLKEKMEVKLIISIVMAIIGIALLTLNGEFAMKFGDVLCIICSFLYSLHIIFTGKFVKKVDTLNLGIFQLGVVGILSLIFTLIFETPTLPKTESVWYSVIVLSIFCTGTAFIIQTYAQKYTSSTHCGLIFSLEPVFAAACAYIFIGEVLTTKGYIGAMLLFISTIIAEFDVKTLIKRQKKKSEKLVKLN